MGKHSVCTNPNGNLWLKDKTHVGYKLMQKMGWSEGKGLGSKEDGLKEAIKVRPKYDAKGVGFHDNSDDNWLVHQDEFNALLCRLNENNVAPLMKMISLEEKSKNSKNRLHYHKYTRGKDLSSCSDKDLACILGKRKNEKGVAESDSSDVTISKMSSRDYFLQKQGMLEKGQEECAPLQLVSLPSMKVQKGKNKMVSHEDEGLSEIDKEEFNSLQMAEHVSKKKKHKRKETSIHDSEEELLVADKEESDSLQMTQDTLNKKKHKRRKTTSIHDSEKELLVANKAECYSQQMIQDTLNKKKHKRKQETSIHDSEEGLLVTDKEECDSLQKKKKKKHERKKETSFYNSEEEEANKDVEHTDETAMKKRKQEIISQKFNKDIPSSGREKQELESLCLLKMRVVKIKPDSKTHKNVKNWEQSLRDDKTEALQRIETLSIKHKNDKKNLFVPEILDFKVEEESCLQTRKRKLKSCDDEVNLGEDGIQDTLNGMAMEVKPNKKKLKMEDKVINEIVEPSTSETESMTIKKSKLKKTDDKTASGNDIAEDELVINKKEFVIGLLTTFRHPSANLPGLFNDFMKGELFNGSNFFSIKGYGEDWL